MILDMADPSDKDLQVTQTEAPRAGNVLSVQLSTLEYAQQFGIDMKFFLESEFNLQPESFKAYCIQRLLQHGVNVANTTDILERFVSTLQFYIGSSETSQAGATPQ